MILFELVTHDNSVNALYQFSSQWSLDKIHVKNIYCMQHHSEYFIQFCSTYVCQRKCINLRYYRNYSHSSNLDPLAVKEQWVHILAETTKSSKR